MVDNLLSKSQVKRVRECKCCFREALCNNLLLFTCINPFLFLLGICENQTISLACRYTPVDDLFSLCNAGGLWISL